MKSTSEAYDGPMARLGGPPEAVAKTIETALTKKHPKPRYLVTIHGAGYKLDVPRDAVRWASEQA